MRIAIFPLSTVVLFPGVQTPLHLFEPRYRQLAEAVLAGDRRIGMVVVPPEHLAAMADDPPVYPVGCAGSLTRAQRLPDGRFDILLAGSSRFRLLSEVERPPERLYRIAEVELLDDSYPESEREAVRALRERIVEQVRALVERADPERGDPLSEQLFEGVDDVAFVNSLCNALAFSAPEKQGLLEAGSVPQRFERLDGLLAFRLAGLGGAAARSETLH